MTGLIRLAASASGLSLLFIIVALVKGYGGDYATARWMAFTAVGISVFALAVWLFEVYKPWHKARHRLKDDE